MIRWNAVLTVCCALVLLGAGGPPPCWGTSLLTYTDTNTQSQFDYPLSGIQFAYVSWTQTVATQDTTVGAIVFTQFAGLGPGTAWLTNAVGPGSTSANVIASAPYTAHEFKGVQELMDLNIATPITMFTGLSLLPGTYYLVLQGPASGKTLPVMWMGDQNGVSVTSAPGFTEGPFGTSAASINSSGAFPPSCTFNTGTYDTGGINLFYSVEGTAVPVPATFLLLGSGLLSLAGWRRFMKS